MLAILLFLQVASCAVRLRPLHTRGSSKPCIMTDCYFDADQVAEGINPYVSPCDDFYSYACGNWIRVKRPYMGKSTYGPLMEQASEISTRVEELLMYPYPLKGETAYKKALKLYDSCVEVDVDKSISSLKAVISSLGGWPLGRQVQVNGWKDVVQRLIKLTKINKIDFPFEIGSTIHAYATYRNNILINKPKNLNKFSQIDANEVAALAKAIDPEVDSNAALTDAKAMLKLPEILKQLDVSVSAFQTQKEFNSITNFDWSSFFAAVFADVKKIATADIITDFASGYLVKVISKANQQPEYAKSLINYVVFSNIYDLLQPLKGRLPNSYANVKFLQQKVDEARISSDCTDIVDKCLPDAMARKYADVFRNLTADLARVNTVFSNSIEALKTRLENSQMLDKQSRRSALEKVDQLLVTFEFPDFVNDLNQLNQFYEPLNVTSDIIWNQHLCNAFNWKDELEDINRPRGKKRWTSSPLTTNALYYGSRNFIVSYEGIMGPPQLYENSSNMIVFTGIGFTLAHEISHGFGSAGTRYDAQGNYIPDSWLSHSSKKNYESVKKCIIKQYDGYSFEPEELPQAKFKLHVNGSDTIEEASADIGAVKLVYDAYKLWVKEHGKEPIPPELSSYTPDQLFFLYHARHWCVKYFDSPGLKKYLEDYHPPNKFRINGALSNFDAFAQAFNCPAKSPMNRGKATCSFF